jgi:low density lipoprotein-related protein 2
LASNSGASPWKPLTGFTKAIGIDFDYRDKKILFSDIGEKKLGSFQVDPLDLIDGDGGSQPRIQNILQRRFNNSSSRFSSSSSLIGMPEGIAYDWISDTIFYADNELNQVVSYKISTNMSYVLSYSESPRTIVVHPCKGYVYWTDIGRRPMIARTSMSGSNFVKLITTDIKWPNGLTIDFDADKLYWADAYYDKIESSNLDGNFRQVLTAAFHPFAITVHNHFIVSLNFLNLIKIISY